MQDTSGQLRGEGEASELHVSIATSANMRPCCSRAGRPGWGLFLCPKCGGASCALHSSIWRDVRECYFCDTPTACLEVPARLTYCQRSPSSASRQTYLLIMDGLYMAGAQRHCLELIEAMGAQDLSCVILALRGGGRWADEFLSVASVILADGHAPVWEDVFSIMGCDDVLFASAQLAAAMTWAAANLPSEIACFAHLHSEPSEHESVDLAWLRVSGNRFKKIFVTCGEALHNYSLALSGSPSSDLARWRILPNGVPAGMQERIARGVVRENGADYPALSVVSRLDADKFDIALFTGAIQRALNSENIARVLVAGSGDLRAALLEAVQASGLEQRVILLGDVANISSIYGLCDAVFMPSKRDGMPYVLLESIAADKPVVAPNIGAMRDLHIEGALFKYAVGDQCGAASAIIKALQRSRQAGPIWTDYAKHGIMEANDWAATVRREYGLT